MALARERETVAGAPGSAARSELPTVTTGPARGAQLFDLYVCASLHRVQRPSPGNLGGRRGDLHDDRGIAPAKAR